MPDKAKTVPAPASAVLVSLSSFGADEVRCHGQLWFAQLVAESDADGVEVRGELLADEGGAAEAELDAIGAVVRTAGLGAVYSSPHGLWGAARGLNEAALDEGLSRAARIGATRLKMSIGNYSADAVPTLDTLRKKLDGNAIELTIENDQTAAAGSLGALRRFFADAASRGLHLGMTFDLGNWHWLGECPMAAAQALGARVCYVHCKGVQREPGRWKAVPLADSSAAWRSALRVLPGPLPWAIEYPLVGSDLRDLTRSHVRSLRELAQSLP